MKTALKDYLQGVYKTCVERRETYKDYPTMRAAYDANLDLLEAINCFDRFIINEIWHDVKYQLPKLEGTYYGKKDDTNSMWIVIYKNKKWYLSCYPDSEFSCTEWAYYDSFSCES